MLFSRMRQFFLALPKRRLYPLVAFVLALGAPYGYFLIRSWFLGVLPLFAVWDAELRRDPMTYGYLFFSTIIVFVTVGYVVGGKQDRVVEQSLTDPLTGLANRRGLLARLDPLARRASADHPLALLLLDVDDLKTINDDLGHESGDLALRAVADALRAVSRGADVAARYGGDEFVLVAADLSQEKATELAERIRSQLRGAVPPGLPTKVSASIGIACGAGSSSDALFERADKALYQAKASGRGLAVVG